MSGIIKFSYNSNDISFDKSNGVMVNATEMAKPFGKQPSDWLKTEQAQRMINAIAETKKSGSVENQLVVTYKGGNNLTKQGTWMHEDLAIEFARWLSPKFAIWCNDRIKELTKYSFSLDQLSHIEKNGNVYFRLSDIARILEVGNDTASRWKEWCDEEEIELKKNQLGGHPIPYVSESAFYRILNRSNSPKAKPFERWVTKIVLPSIRKHGAYMTDSTIEKALESPDFLIQLATKLKEEKQKRIEAELKNKELQFENDMQEHIINEQRPKVIFANTVESSDTSILVGELAKLIAQKGVNIGQNRLFEWLKKNGFTCKRNGINNYPTQKAITQKLLEVRERTITKPDGSTFVTFTTKVTGKGQIFFINQFVYK